MLTRCLKVMKQIIQLGYPDVTGVLALGGEEQNFIGHVPLFFAIGPRCLRADILGHHVSQVRNLFVLLDSPEFLFELIHGHLLNFVRFAVCRHRKGRVWRA